MRGPFRSRRRLAAIAATLLVASTFADPAGAGDWSWSALVARWNGSDAPPHVVKDPYFGDAIFYFYQERYFTSLTGLMTSQQFDRVQHHADEAEILRAGMLLSYGMHHEAGEIFARLIDRGAEPPVRDRAWYFLAKIRYQRGFLAEAEDAIERIGDQLPPELQEDKGLLHANLMMARSDYAGAAKVLEAMVMHGSGGLYARYNLGVALMHSADGADVARGVSLLDGVGSAPAVGEENANLRDKANVALGFAALKADEPERARGALERVRLNGMLSNKALLGFGWSKASLKQPKEALVPWTELAGRDISDPAVLEAKLAVPYAYEQLGAYGQSLDLYTDAIAVFEHEGNDLDESIAAIRSGKLLDGLLARNPGEEMGWFWSIRQLPEMPHAGHLTQVLAQHDFQEAFKNYRDLLFLDRNLRDWAGKLGIYGDMLANRRQAYAERLPQIRAQERSTGVAALQHRHDELAAALARAEADTDVHAFEDPHERELDTRLRGVLATLQQRGADPQLDADRERARRVAGALDWRLSGEFPARLWDAKGEFKSLDAELARSAELDAALAKSQREEPARFDAFAARIAELRARIQALTPRVAELIAQQRQQVQELATAELLREKDRLAVYSNQARFSVAHIQDRANADKDTRHAPAQ